MNVDTPYWVPGDIKRGPPSIKAEKELMTPPKLEPIEFKWTQKKPLHQLHHFDSVYKNTLFPNPIENKRLPSSNNHLSNLQDFIQYKYDGKHHDSRRSTCSGQGSETHSQRRSKKATHHDRRKKDSIRQMCKGAERKIRSA